MGQLVSNLLNEPATEPKAWGWGSPAEAPFRRSHLVTRGLWVTTLQWARAFVTLFQTGICFPKGLQGPVVSSKGRAHLPAPWPCHKGV